MPGKKIHAQITPGDAEPSRPYDVGVGVLAKWRTGEMLPAKVLQYRT